MKLIIFTLIICLHCWCADGQVPESLSVTDCYVAARQNYPLVRQLELIAKSTAYSVENAATGYLPQANINGQLSYQSDVTKIPLQLPGIDMPQMSKGQYKIFAEASQLIYDGGMIRQQQKMAVANAATASQKLEVELYQLQDRINQLFFGILLITGQLQQNDLIRKDIQLGIDKASVAVVNGSGLKSSVSVLKAELMKVNQRGIEQQFARKSYLDMLGLFINKTIPENIQLVNPTPTVTGSEITRPELKWFEDQKTGLDVQEMAVGIKNRPKFGAFAQAGVGRPGLNMLSNGSDPFAIAGIKMSWPLTGWYTAKKDKAIIELNRKAVDLQKETFLLNTNIQLKQQDRELQKLNELLKSDDEIIALRVSVKKVSAVQLENGAVSTSDYLREVNAEDQARQNKLLHEIQLITGQYQKQMTTGIKY
jgi:outer membrane protein TolC